MAVGDPNQAIYGWRGASVSNILDFDKDLPSREGRARRFTLAVNRRSDRRILETANHLAATLYDTTRDSGRLAPGRRRGPGRGRGRASTRPGTTSSTGWPTAYAGHAPRWRSPHGAASASSRATTPTPQQSTTGSASRDPRRDRRAQGPAPPARGGGGCRDADPDRRRHRQRVTCSPLLSGAAVGVGPRDLALLGRRPREIAGRRGGDDGSVPLEAELLGSSSTARPHRDRLALRRARRPRRPRTQPEARDRFALLSTSCAACVRPRRRTRSSTSSGASSRSPASTSSSRRRARLRRQRVATTSTSSSRPSPSSRGSTGRSPCPPCSPGSRPRTSSGRASTWPRPSEADSVKLLTVHRAKGLEWHVVFLVGVCEGRFPTSQGRSTSVTVAHVLPVALRGDRPTSQPCAGTRPTTSRPSRRRPRSATPSRSCGSPTSRCTRAKHRLFVVRLVLRATPQDRHRAVGLRPRDARGARVVGRGPRALAGLPAARRRQPLRRRRDGPAVADLPPHPGGRPPARGGPPHGVRPFRAVAACPRR